MLNLIAQAGRGTINNPAAPHLSPASSQAGGSLFESLLKTIISGLFVVGVLAFITFFIIGAIRWILSSGDKNSLEGARQQVLHAFIGLIVLFGLYAILKLLEGLFGVCLINLSIPGISSASTGSSCAGGIGSGGSGTPAQ